MVLPVKVYNILLLLCFIKESLSTSGEQKEEVTAPGSPFLAPLALSPDEDSFIYKDTKEFIIVNKELEWRTASLYCQKQHESHLAHVKDEEDGKFLAEALSETTTTIDELWIGGQKHKSDSESEPQRWFWVSSTEKGVEEIDDFLLDDYLPSRENPAANHKEKECLTFARKSHSDPFFVELGCDSLRPFICQRAAYSRDLKDPTHPDWVPIGLGVYKIFPEKHTYESANFKCFDIDREASLAVVPTTSVANILGRYLLISRPSLENAWIGAKFEDKNKWSFASTGTHLPEKPIVGPDGLNFPPWPSDIPLKNGGCLLLDRHTSNITIFLPARCERTRPFICYKPLKNLLGVGTTDFPNMGQFDYRLYRNKAPWHIANETCIKKGGKLAEPLNGTQIGHYLTVMGDNRTAINHMWLGAKFDKVNGWQYASPSKEPFPLQNFSSLWVKNTSFVAEIEEDYSCLNIDRENQASALLYGTICHYPQVYLCQWDVSKMLPELEGQKTRLGIENVFTVAPPTTGTTNPVRIIG